MEARAVSDNTRTSDVATAPLPLMVFVSVPDTRAFDRADNLLLYRFHHAFLCHRSPPLAAILLIIIAASSPAGDFFALNI
jgi:hypothetical protein